MLTEVDVEGSPLLGAGKKVPPLHMKIPGTDRLGTQTVKQCHLSPWSDAHWGERKRLKEKKISVSVCLKPYSCLSMRYCVCRHILQLTICIFQGLFLLGWLGDDLDPLAEEDSYVGAVPIQHLHSQHEVFPFIRVTDIQCLSCAEVLMQGQGTG